MDRRLFDASVRGDAETLRQLVAEDDLLLDQVATATRATPLHLAARFGHVGFAAEVLRLRPAMVSAEDASLEIPLHEACRQGSLEMVQLMLDTDPVLAYRLNPDGESALAVACHAGNLEVVRFLLRDTRVSRLEVDSPFTALHSAALYGHAEIVQELLKVQPSLASTFDKFGFSPLHHACWKGHLDVTRVLLQFDSDLCSQRDVDGRTPLHLAAIKGWISILDEILSQRLDIAEILTSLGETALHLTVKYNRLEAFKYLMEKLDGSEFINLQDGNGYTILHLAVAGKHTQMVEYLVDKTTTDLNACNQNGCTSLDLTQENGGNPDTLSIRLILLKAGAERNKATHYLLPSYASSRNNRSSVSQKSQNLFNSFHQREIGTKFHDEHMGSAAETVMVAATLLATVAFSASISPPGGVYEGGESIGTAVMARNVFFKIFTVTNDLALLTSLSIVMGLATIIPFKQKSVSRHFPKIYWSMYSAVVFTLLAYLSSRLLVFQSRSGYTKWLMLPLCVVAPIACILFFWRMWNRPELDHRDVVTEITKTTIMTGADQIPEAKRNDMMKTGWKSSSGASHWIGDVSRRDGRNESSLIRQLSLWSHQMGIVNPNAPIIRHSY